MAMTQPTENQIQATVIQWRDRMTPQHPELRWLFAIPNGEKRDPIVGAKLKAQGVVRGVPDLCLPVPTREYDSDFRMITGYYGLFIEVKTLIGKLKDEQAEWRDYLRLAGYRAEVCRGVDATLDTICEYLSIERGY